MKKYIEIPYSDLRAVSYTNPNRSKDELELFFLSIVFSYTGFPANSINLLRAEKTRYKRYFNRFEFEYNSEKYVLENGLLQCLA